MAPWCGHMKGSPVRNQLNWTTWKGSLRRDYDNGNFSWETLGNPEFNPQGGTPRCDPLEGTRVVGPTEETPYVDPLDPTNWN